MITHNKTARAMLRAMLHKRHHDGGYSPDLYEIDPFIAEAIHAAREAERKASEIADECVPAIVATLREQAAAKRDAIQLETFPGVDPVRAAEWWSRVE